MSKLRQELRDKAGKDLTEMVEEVLKTADAVTQSTSLGSYDLLRLASGGRTATLQHKMVTELADDLEVGLLLLYNTQQDLPLKDKK